MPLINNIEDIGSVLPKLVANASNFSIQPNFTRAEQKYLVPLIGATLYNTLVTANAANDLDADQTILVKHLRLVAAAYAYYDEAGIQLLKFGDSGIQNINQGGTERVFKWQLDELKETLLRAAHDGTDVLLSYLFANENTYDEWTASDEYSKLKSLLIRTGTDLNDQYMMYQPQRCLFLLRGVMNDVQRLAIQEDIGEDLLTYLRDKDTPTAKEKECIGFLKKALAFYTVAKACQQMAVSWTNGIFTILGEKMVADGDKSNAAQVNVDLLMMKMREAIKEGDAYMGLAKNKLVANYTDASVTTEFTTALDAGPLKDYVQPADRTSGNENRKIFSF